MAHSSKRKKKKIKVLRIVYGLIILSIAFVVVVAMIANTPQKEVLVAPSHVLQSDTFLVKVSDEKKDIAGTFDSKKLAFFRSQDNNSWVAIVGVGVKKQPGTYQLAIEIPGRPPYKKDII